MLMRQLQTPTGPNQEATRVAPISAGGTSATNKRDAVNNLGGISKDEYGQPSGVVQLDAEGKIPSTLLPPLEDFKYSLHGPTVMAHGESAEFYVTNYSHDRPLSVTVTNGASFVVQTKENILVTAPPSGNEFKLTVNERSMIIRCSRPGALKPHLEFIGTEGNRKSFYASAFRDGPRTYSNWTEVTSSDEFVVEANVSGVWLRGQAYGSVSEVGALVNGKMHSVNDGDTIRIINVEPGQRVAVKTQSGKPLSYRKIYNTTRHTNTHWQLSKDRNFTTTYKENRATKNLRKWEVEIEPGIYYLRFAYNVDTPGVSNEWSDTYTVSLAAPKTESEKSEYAYHSVIDLIPYTDLNKTDVIDLDKSGDFALVGSPSNPDGQGFFSLYRRKAAMWQLLSRVSAKETRVPGPTDSEENTFAKAVKISANGKTIAVLDTAIRKSENHVTATNQEGLLHGCIYIYRYADGEINHETTLFPDENQTCSSKPLLSEDGNEIVYFSSNVLQHYRYNGVSWTKVSTYALPSHDEPWALASSSDLTTVAVGYMSSNKVIILKRDVSGNYSFSSEVVQTEGATGVNFGYSLDLSSDASVLAIGSPVISNTVYGTSTPGTVDIFDLDSETYRHREKLIGRPGAMYGKSISLNEDGSAIAIGAPNTGETEKYNSLPRCGAVYVKNFTTGTVQTFRRDIEFAETEYGEEVILDGRSLLVTTRKRGSVFVYRKNK